MTRDEFWKIIDDAAAVPYAERVEKITSVLKDLPSEEVDAFEGHLYAERVRAEDSSRFEKALDEFDYVGDDSFMYATQGVMLTGRATFEKALTSTSYAIDVVEELIVGTPGEWEFRSSGEQLGYVAMNLLDEADAPAI